MRRTAYNAALNLLARREQGAGELTQKLKQKGFEADAVEAALIRLKQQNLQCDRRYAQSQVHAMLQRGLGPVRIRQQLHLKQLAQTLIEAAIEEAAPNWCEQLQAVWQKKFDCAPQDYATRAKQARFLVYRGFEPDHVQQFLHSLPTENRHDDHE